MASDAQYTFTLLTLTLCHLCWEHNWMSSHHNYTSCTCLNFRSMSAIKRCLYIFGASFMQNVSQIQYIFKCLWKKFLESKGSNLGFGVSTIVIWESACPDLCLCQLKTLGNVHNAPLFSPVCFLLMWLCPTSACCSNHLPLCLSGVCVSVEGLQGVQHTVHQSELAAETHADAQRRQALQGKTKNRDSECFQTMWKFDSFISSKMFMEKQWCIFIRCKCAINKLHKSHAGPKNKV